METNKIIKYSTASLYVVLYVIVATISCICSIDFFDMTHNNLSSIILAISFEIGSMGCLFGALTTLRNRNITLIWVMFIFLTLMQMMNNTYYAYSHIDNYKDWVELFNLIELEEITQKRIISIISGCVLPIVSLSFIHLLVELLKNGDDEKYELDDYESEVEDEIKETNEITDDENVYDAVPLNDEQIKEFDKKNRKKSEIEIAKEEMMKALHKVEDYKENITNE